MSNEVIELDEDGNFNIPSPPKTKNIETIYEIIEPSNEEIDRKLSELKSINILNTMEEGEFKIYDDEKKVVIFVKVSILIKDKIKSSIISKDKKLIFEVNNSNNIAINLPENMSLNFDTMKSKIYENYITTTIDKTIN